MHHSPCAGALRTKRHPQSDRLLAALENQEALAWVPGIWRYEMLNALGKGITRTRLTREKAFLLWREIQALPIRFVDVPGDEKLLELSLQHNLAAYDACSLSVKSYT